MPDVLVVRDSVAHRGWMPSDALHVQCCPGVLVLDLGRILPCAVPCTLQENIWHPYVPNAVNTSHGEKHNVLNDLFIMEYCAYLK